MRIKFIKSYTFNNNKLINLRIFNKIYIIVLKAFKMMWANVHNTPHARSLKQKQKPISLSQHGCGGRPVKDIIKMARQLGFVTKRK
jgi:hypothetical protein